jgi:hypothetical protein
MLRAAVLGLGLIVAGTAAAPGLAAQVELLMIEQAGCVYCTRWHAEVGPEYPITDEGRAAPLRTHQLRDDLPEGIKLARPAVFTPTFVLLKDGAEVDRIEGYPGEDFFWGLLDRMIAAAR